MKKGSLILLLFCSALLLFSCHDEDNLAELENKPKLAVRKINLDELATNTKASQKIKKLNKFLLENNNDSLKNRTVYNEIYNFSIDIDNILAVEYGNYTSYTLPVIRENETSLTENLFLHRSSNGEYISFLITYDFDEQDKINAQNGLPVDYLNQKTTYTLLEAFDPDAVLNKDSNTSPGCVMQFTTVCEYDVVTTWGPPNQGDLVGEFSPDVPYTSYIFSGCNYTMVGPGCDTGGGGGSGIDPFNPPYGGSGGSGTGGSSTPGPNTNPNVTNPVITIPFVKPTTNPCESMKSIGDVNKMNFKASIDWLKGKVNAPVNDKEHGVEIQKIMNADETYSYPKTNVSSSQEYSVDLMSGGRYIGGAHSHPKEGYGMFSFADVRFLCNTYQGTYDSLKPDVFFTLVCKHPVTGIVSVYTIKVDDIAKLTAQVNAVWNHQDYAEFTTVKQRLEAIHKVQEKEYKKNVNQLEKSFLQQFSAFGISLYKANDDSMTNWTQLKLSSGTQPIVNPIPCN